MKIINSPWLDSERYDFRPVAAMFCCLIQCANLRFIVVSEFSNRFIVLIVGRIVCFICCSAFPLTLSLFAPTYFVHCRIVHLLPPYAESSPTFFICVIEGTSSYHFRHAQRFLNNRRNATLFSILRLCAFEYALNAIAVIRICFRAYVIVVTPSYASRQNLIAVFSVSLALDRIGRVKSILFHIPR